jgi:hypothetical protein
MNFDSMARAPSLQERGAALGALWLLPWRKRALRFPLSVAMPRLRLTLWLGLLNLAVER